MPKWMLAFFLALGVLWPAGPGALADPSSSSTETAGSEDEPGCARRIQALKDQLEYEPGSRGPRKGAKVEMEGGSSHTYSESGPVKPIESWFDSSPRPTAKATLALHAAIAAKEAGDMNKCRKEVSKAEKVLAEAKEDGTSR